MNNNEMVEYKGSFVTRIRNFFKRIFGKSEEKSNYIQEELIDQSTEEKMEKNTEFIDRIKVDENTINTEADKEAFLNKIDGNEEALRMLSIDRLKKLEEYYNGVIAKNEEKIRKLKAEV